MKLNTTGLQSYKLLTFVGMLLLTTDIASSLIAYKFIRIGFITTTASVFIAILAYPICDIISEVYGYTTLKRIVWFRLICDYIFGLFLKYGLLVPAIAAWHFQNDYEVVFGHYMRLIISGTIALLISSFLNGFLIAKWKIALHGKAFWLRSIGSTIIAVICNDILVLVLAFGGLVKFEQLFFFIVWTFLITMIFIILISPITTLLCKQLKKFEGVDVYERRIDWNPFQLKETIKND